MLNSPNSPSQERCSSTLISSVPLFWTCSNKYMSLLCWIPHSWMQLARWGLMRAEYRETESSPSACWCSPGHSWLSGLWGQSQVMLSFSPMNTFTSFSPELSIYSPPSLAFGLAELCEVCISPPLNFVNVPLDFIKLVVAYCSSVEIERILSSVKSIKKLPNFSGVTLVLKWENPHQH